MSRGYLTAPVEVWIGVKAMVAPADLHLLWNCDEKSAIEVLFFSKTTFLMFVEKTIFGLNTSSQLKVSITLISRLWYLGLLLTSSESLLTLSLIIKGLWVHIQKSFLITKTGLICHILTKWFGFFPRVCPNDSPKPGIKTLKEDTLRKANLS